MVVAVVVAVKAVVVAVVLVAVEALLVVGSSSTPVLDQDSPVGRWQAQYRTRTPQATKISSTVDEPSRLCFDEQDAL